MENNHKILFRVESYSGRELNSHQDRDRLQKLCESCSDYSELCEGRSPGPNAAKEVFEDLPPGKSIEDKLVIGIENKDGSLIGVIEGCKDYPEENIFFIGLMMIEPKSRNNQLGESLYRAYEYWCIQRNITDIMLGVVEENTKGYRFWNRMGFGKVREVKNYEIADKITTVKVMKKSIVYS